MVTPLRRRLRLARRGAWYAIVLALVVTAVVLGVVSQVLPLAERHPEKIAAWLSERAGRPVAFDRVQTRWTRRGPLLRLDGLRLGRGADAVGVGEAEVLVSMYAGLLPGRSFTELRLRNLSLTLERAEDGRWSVRGLPGQNPGGDPLRHLEGLGELQIIDASLAVLAPSLGWNVRVPEIDLRLRVDGDRVRAGALARMRADARPLRLSLDFDRRRGDGRGYVHADGMELAHWTPLLRYAGVAIDAGQGRARTWVELRAHQVVGLASELQLRGVGLLGAPLDDGAPATRLNLGVVRASTRWRVDGGDWTLRARSLRIGDPQAPRKLDGLVLAGGREWALQADELDMQPLLAALALSDRVPAPLRRWLSQANPGARLFNVSLAGTRTGVRQAHGRLQALGFKAVGERPGISGLAGEFDGDAGGFTLALDPRAPVRFDWPVGFGVTHDVNLQGALTGWREGEGWRVGTPSLRIGGADYGATMRGALWFQGDGTRPRLELAADIDQAPVVAAKGFWVRHRMSKPALRWLDQALLGGQVIGGRALVSGDLDDWPFVANDGRFEATARIAQGRFKFNPEWPTLDQVDADIAFVGNGFSIDGSGSLAGVRVQSFEAGIADFGAAELAVRAESATDASRLLALTRLGPLNRQHADTLANLRAKGPARATFDLLQPLRAGQAAPTKMSGSVELLGAELAEARWDLAFDGVRGRVEYGAGGFRAERLAVRRNGQPGVLALRAGDGTRDSNRVFEAELSAAFGATELLERAPEMAWLRPYMDGRSTWNVELAIPRANKSAGGATMLRLRSDLVGTALKLPAPLDKPAQRALATAVQTALPVAGGQIDVAFGQLLAVRARSSAAGTGVRVVLGDSADGDAPPPSGLVVTGQATRLDALEWIALAQGGGGNAGASAGASADRGERLPLRRIDIGSDRLWLLGAEFPDARLQVVPADGALAVAVQGPGLAGDLRVPDAGGAAITGTFSRVHWRARAQVPPSGEAATGGSPRASEADPAGVPPLALDIDDLRFGQARLGSATLRTQPVPAGMRVRQLALRSEGQRIDIEGEWTGRGTAARTRMSTAIASEDFGRLLDAFGFEGQVAGGRGDVRFDAGWDGTPAAFSLAALQGRLRIDARAGQLLELEPGAGRVLGLLGIAQLPRRMLLDFRDFFSKGFAFDRIQGTVGIGAGIARSDQLAIDGPAARIQISGSTDLRAQRFDQTIEVQPRSGNLLTVVGAFAGGPLGAAVGAAANAVLSKPLG
ncbi:MAG TPA: YhdP family protein, partial [Pseudoxanthomonas sp.]|nr:YhdP family protein [Pseudoxanthomonas sp.]